MPKEVTHWVIADEVARQLDNSVFKAAQTNRNALLIGAVFHDILYYYRGKNNEIIILPDHLHGARKDDTYDVVRRILAKLYGCSGGDRECLLAFLAGVITHIFADIHFHPMVYHMTGNYYESSKAVIRHRTLECVLDFYFCEHFREQYDFNRVFSECTCDYSRLFSDLYSVPMGNNNDQGQDIAEDIIGSYRFFTKFRGIYSRRFIGNILHTMDFLFPTSLKKISAVFYADRLKKSIPKLSNKIDYQNPVTGDSFEVTLEEFKTKTVEDSVEFCLYLEKECLGKENPVIKGKGASLETGLVGSNVDDMKHFNIFKFA